MHSVCVQVISLLSFINLTVLASFLFMVIATPSFNPFFFCFFYVFSFPFSLRQNMFAYFVLLTNLQMPISYFPQSFEGSLKIIFNVMPLGTFLTSVTRSHFRMCDRAFSLYVFKHSLHCNIVGYLIFF